jgi:hypothetical protein
VEGDVCFIRSVPIILHLSPSTNFPATICLMFTNGATVIFLGSQQAVGKVPITNICHKIKREEMNTFEDDSLM